MLLNLLEDVYICFASEQTDVAFIFFFHGGVVIEIMCREGFNFTSKQTDVAW